MLDGTDQNLALALEKLGTTSRFELAAGEQAFRADDPVEFIFRLEAGRIRLLRHSPEGAEVTLHVARAGETFAEASLFAEHYHCDAVADVPSKLLGHTKAHVLQALCADPEFSRYWIEHLSRQVQTLRARVELMNLRPARCRVLAYLRSQSTNDRIIRLDRSWKSIATDLGLTHEAVYRALAGLERDGLIARDRTRPFVELRYPQVG